MGLFKSKVKHQPMGASAAFVQAFGPTSASTPPHWSTWIPKFKLAGERDQCFVGQLVLVNGAAHFVLDGVDYGPTSEHGEGLDAIAGFGGQSCPAVLRITKPTAENYSISVRMPPAAN